MPLTESAKRYYFGSKEPQQLRDYSGAGNTLLYEGYAVQGLAEDQPGWVIVLHAIDGSTNMDNGQKLLAGQSWSLRTYLTFP